AISLTGDKLAMCRHWQANEVPTPSTDLVRAGITIDAESFPVVVKPRFGAGSTAMRRADDGAALLEELQECAIELWGGDLIVQPYVKGVAASVSFLTCEDLSLPLLAGRQQLSDDGRFRYLGGELPLAEDLSRRAVDLAVSAIAGISGLRGYVGVDL